MTFAAPLFLLAALAAAIPILLHMIHRRRAKELPFSTLRFLKISVQKTRRRKRIHDVLLMIVRAAILLLIAAGLAKPAVTHLGSLWGAAHSAAVIVLDNSGSMGLVDQDQPRVDTAVAAATQILDQFIEGDQTAVLVTCGPVFPNADALARNQDTARQILAQCRASYQRADLKAKVEQARAMLESSDAPNKHVFVITDMQRVSWEGGGGEASGQGGVASGQWLVASEERQATINDQPSSQSAPPVPVVLVDCNRAPKPNVAVQGVAIDTVAPVAGVSINATATLLNASSVPGQPRVELWIDGSKEASSPELMVPPGERVKQEFTFTFQRGGLHRGEVRLAGEDGSTFDDRRYFAMHVDQSIPAAIVRAKRHEIAYLDDAYYIQQALASSRAGGWAVQTTPLVVEDLAQESLEKYKVIYCVNLPALDGKTAERLRTYVENGGNLVWFCGDNVVPAAYNEMNRQADEKLLPTMLGNVRSPSADEQRDSWHVSYLDKDFPAFRRLAEPASLYESILVYKFVRMAEEGADSTRSDPLSKEAGAVRVLARLDDGEPLIVMRDVGKGRTLLFGIPARIDWTNLPLRPIFLPLLSRVTFTLADVEQRSRNLIAGQPIELDLPEKTEPLGVEIIPPSGETLRLKTREIEGRAGQTFRYNDTYQTGVYLLRLLDESQSAATVYCVNSDPDEAEAAVIDRRELEAILAPPPLVLAEDPDDLSDVFALLREGRSLWGVFLGLVLIVLIFETYVSNRFSARGD